MIFQLFRNKHAQLKKTSQANKSNSLYNTLTKGLTQMEKEGVDRVILALYESEPDQDVNGKWLTSGKDTCYYPFEMLGGAEQSMILDKKHYTAVALVNENVGNIVRYKNKGIEKYQRTRLNLLMPKLKPESEWNYSNNGGVYTGENLKKFAEWATESGWIPEAIKQVIDEGIQEYHEITKKLMEKAGVYDSLQKMEKRKFSKIEGIMLAKDKT